MFLIFGIGNYKSQNLKNEQVKIVDDVVVLPGKSVCFQDFCIMVGFFSQMRVPRRWMYGLQSTPFHGAEEHADNRCKKNLLIMRASRIVLWKLMMYV